MKSILPMSRRAFLGGLAAGVTVGCQRTQPQSTGEFAGQELRIFVYAGGHETTMRSEFLPAFEAATGASVVLVSGWWDGIAKLKSSPPDRPPYDLMITDATQGIPAAKDGLFATLDFDAMPNLKSLDPSALKTEVAKSRLGVTYPDSVQTLAYTKNATTEPPVRWSDLLREPLRGKISLYRSFYMSLYTFACMLADERKKPAHELIEQSTDDVFRFATTHRDRVGFWWQNSTEMILALTNGDALAGNMHSPEYWQSQRENAQLLSAIPLENRAFVQVFWAVPAGCQRKALAERAIDFLFSDAMQLAFARRGSATANLSVAKQMATESSTWKAMYPNTAEELQNLRYYPYDFYAKNWTDLADRWERTVVHDARR